MSPLIAALENPTTFVIVAALLGLAIGSFLNVVIHRLPKMMEREWRAECAELQAAEPAGARNQGSGAAPAAADTGRYNLFVPRSACPSCGRGVRATENIPIVSWLILRGKCAGCKAPISMRYPIVEATTGLAFAYAAWHFGPGWAAWTAMLFLAVVIALSVIDFDTQFLPDSLTLPLVWAGLLVNLRGTFVPIDDAVIGAAAGYLTLWAVYWLFKLATGKEGMGYGDFKLLGAIGAWLGWKILPFVILASSAVGAVIGVGLIILAKRGREVPMPFGPYLAIAGITALFWGPQLVTKYLDLLY
ncbi:MAG: A24 family peptidase [Burkholderiales bacterium]